MSYFDLKIGMRCNNNCVHCVVADRRVNPNCEPDLTYAGVLKVLKGAGLENEHSIVITGGEPTTFEYLGRLLRYIHKTYPNLTICLQTNGRLLHRFIDDFAYLYDNGAKLQIVIAIHADTAELHDKITNVENSNSFHQTISNIKLFSDKFGDKFVWRSETVLSNFNVDRMCDIVEFVHTLNCKMIGISYPHLENFYQFKLDFTLKEIGFDYDKLAVSLPRLNSFIQEHPEIEFMLEEFPPCLWLNDKHKLPLPNLEQVALTSFDTKEGGRICYVGEDEHDYHTCYMESRRKYERCKSCVYTNRCTGIWYESYESFENLALQPVTAELEGGNC